MSKPGRHSRAKDKRQRKKLLRAAKIAGTLGGPKFRRAAKKVRWP